MNTLNYDTACLAVLSIGQWSARKKDKRATKEATARAGARDGVVSVNKSLLPFNEQLARIHQKTTHIRTEFYRRTLPWGFEGVYLLPVANFEFIEWFDKQKGEWWALVRDLLEAYIDLRAKAKEDLGALFDDDDYPPVAVVRHKFSIDMQLMPVPGTDLRVKAGSTKAEKLFAQKEAELREKILANHKEAINKLWRDLHDKVSHLHEKLANASATFKDATVTNIADQVEMVRRMNFTNDPDLEAIRKEVQAKLVYFTDPHDLRTDLDLRRKKAEETKAILDKMAGFMGGNN